MFTKKTTTPTPSNETVANETLANKTVTKGDASMTSTDTTNTTEDTTTTVAEKKNLEIPASARRPGMFGAMSTTPAVTTTPNMGFSQSTTTTQSGLGQTGLGSNAKKLVIGEGITISGDINSCEYLVVDGTVKSDFKGSDRLDITSTGDFTGSAETNEAEIAGNFDGTLVVNGRLTVREGGRIKGSVYYRELAVEAGSVLEGKLNYLKEGEKVSATTARKTKKTSARSTKKTKTTTATASENVTQMQLATS